VTVAVRTQGVNEPQTACCEWNLQNDAWDWDPALAVVFGRREDLFIASASAILEMKHPDDLETSRSVVNAVRGSGVEFSYSNRIFRSDGYVRKVHAAAAVNLDSAGLPALMRATIEVMSDWKMPFSDCELATATDGELMLGLRAKLPEAQTEVFRRHAGGVAEVARWFGAVASDDVVQDVFETLFRSPERFDARRGGLRTYLKMAARTRHFDEMRAQTARRRRESVSERHEIAPPSEVEALKAISGLQMRHAIAAIPPEQRVAIELAFFGGLSYRAVAEHLGLPEGTVKGRIREGLRRLRDIVDPS
jgi:RNA polymerase sigma factor (sigma-70 family)